MGASNSLQINDARLARGLLRGTTVRRTAKTRGGVVVGVLVCFLLPFTAKPQLAHALLHRLQQFHWNRFSRPAQTSQMAALPNLFFWAWERPEDLRFLESRDAGVAFLAKTIYVPVQGENLREDAGGSIFVRPRLQPLRVAQKTPLIVVVRIETRSSHRPASFVAGSLQSTSRLPFTPHQNQRLVDEIVDLQKLPNVRAIQIDFDATASERFSYATLLKDVRGKLPTSLPLSITALASWCIGDAWLARLPPDTIDEAVPMLFRMGPDTGDVARFLRSGEEFRAPACRSSLGLSTDESLSNGLLKGTFPSTLPELHFRRIYVFAPRAWTQTTAEAVLKEWQP